MTQFKASKTTTRLALIAAVILAAGPAIADKPSWAGGGDKHEKHGQSEEHQDPVGGNGDAGHNHDKGDPGFKANEPGFKGGDPGFKANEPGFKGGDPGFKANEPGFKGGDPSSNGGRYFIGDPQRTAIRDYYDHEYRTGHCPPGLAKKDNGCMPPGQAKKWVMGRPLPRDVTFYNLPTAVVTAIGPPPAGYRYVRVGPDILLIRSGLGIVTDVINNWGR